MFVDESNVILFAYETFNSPFYNSLRLAFMRA